MPIDLNQIAQSFYDTVLNLNQTAIETVGINVKWCRSIPYENSEDVILQEYTLLNVECPKDLKIVTSKTDYNPGALTVDFFGINYEAPLEISITIQSWQEVYGKGSQPQKDDIVYIPLLNKLYQVATATVDYGWAEQPTGFKCQLVKYNPHASRRESEDMIQSIEDMTVSQERLFGETLSKQIADLTDPEQFDNTISTYIDPYKEFNMDTVITEDINIDGNIVSRSHYNFSNSIDSIKYPDVQDMDNTHPWRLFTCWFRLKNEVVKHYNIDITELYNKNKSYWQIKAVTEMSLNEGDIVTLTRGKNISIKAIVNSKHKNLYLLDIETPEALRISKLVTNWWNIKGYYITNTYKCNLLSSDILNINIENNKLAVNNKIYDCKLLTDKWFFLSIQKNSKTEEVRIYTPDEEDKLSEYFKESSGVLTGSFNNANFCINNIKCNFDLTNIRYYMSNKKTTINHIKEDALSRFTKSNSLAVLLDNAEIPSKLSYIGESK